MTIVKIQALLTRHFKLTPMPAPIARIAASIAAETGWAIPMLRRERGAFLRRYTETNRASGSVVLFKDYKAEQQKRRTADKDFYESAAWRDVRYRALKQHGAKCQCCGATAISSGAPIHVDHIKPRSKFPELELNIKNLQVLCRDCNLGKRAWDQTDWRPDAILIAATEVAR